MKKSILSLAAAAALSFACATSASALPVNAANALGADAGQSSTVQSVHWRSYRHNHGWRGNRGWRGGGYGYGRRCWRSCTGIGPVRVCKRRCRW